MNRITKNFSVKNIFSRRVATLTALLFVSLTLTSCAFFKVDKLKPELLAKLPVGNVNGLLLPVQNGIVYEVPLRVGALDDYLIISESSRNRIKIFKDNKPIIIISSLKNQEEQNNVLSKSQEKEKENTSESEEKKIEQSDFVGTEVKFFLNEYLDIPERIVTGKNKDFFVVNYVRSGSSENVKEEQGYYKILHFGIDGEYYGVIGRNGQIELPFDSIVWLDTDNEGRLWVLYQQMGEYILEQFENRKALYNVNENECVNALFSESERQDTNISFTCERILPFFNGKRVMFYGKAEAIHSPEKKSSKQIYYHRLAWRDLEKNETFIVFDEFTEENEYLALPVGEQVYMWNPSDPNRVRVSVYNLEGSRETNLQPEFLGRRSSWKNIYYRLDATLFGIRIFDNQFTLYRWK